MSTLIDKKEVNTLMYFIIAVSLNASLGPGHVFPCFCSALSVSIMCLLPNKAEMTQRLVPCYRSKFLGQEVFPCHVTSCLSLQKEKEGIVMVNFYNDYVTCSKTAKIADVAGKPPDMTMTITVNLVKY